MALTRRQKQVLDFLVGFINRQGYSPSFEEIGDALGLSSLATVHKHLGTLEKKGFIRGGRNRSRSVEVVAVPGLVPFSNDGAAVAGPEGAARRSRPRANGGGPIAPAELGALAGLEFPLLGRIAAGQPVEAIANPETFSLGDFAGGKSNIFVLKVKGDSMIDDHICDGDYILVEGAETAHNGEIVVALTDGTDATLKRFFREGDGKVRLQPANAQMDPLVLPARNVKMQGGSLGCCGSTREL